MGPLCETCHVNRTDGPDRKHCRKCGSKTQPVSCQTCGDIIQQARQGKIKRTCDVCKSMTTCRGGCGTRLPRTGKLGPVLCDDCSNPECIRCEDRRTGKRGRRYCDLCRVIAHSESSVLSGRAGKGRSSSLKGKFSLRNYSSAENRAKQLVPNTGCALAGEGYLCSAGTEMTFWHESAPAEWVRIDKKNGRPYWIGPEDQIELAYRWLCRSHHARTDPAHLAKHEPLSEYRSERCKSPEMREAVAESNRRRLGEKRPRN